MAARLAIVALAVAGGFLLGPSGETAHAAGGPASRARPPRPADLRPSAPRLLAPRAAPAVVVVDVVRNAGGRRSRRARTRFLLARPGAGQLGVGRRSIPPLRPGGVSRRTVTLRLPASVAPGAWSVIACVGADCRTSLLPVRVPFPPPPPPPPPPAPPPPVERAAEPAPAPAPAPPSTDRAAIEDCGPEIADNDAPAAAFTSMFAATTSGWTGGDGTFSARLPSGETLWLFGDTFLGGLTGGGGRDRPFPDVRNTAVVQGADCLTTLFRGTLDVPFSFEPADEDEQAEWYWLNQPVVHGDRIRVFATRVHQGPEAVGSVLATYDLDLARVSVGAALPTLEDQWWGAAIVDDEDAGATYVFGLQDASPRNVYLARTPYQDLDGAWEYRTADGWSDDLADARPVLADATRLATQISVLHDPSGWALVSQDRVGDGVSVWRAAEPWDWGERATLTTLDPPAGATAYNALVHPELADGSDLLLSYNLLAPPEDTMADASLYRPRFVRVALPPAP
ncbi:MAG TPA: hypothetical protein VF549_19255 [Solirubrobacteraceae bacterium]